MSIPIVKVPNIQNGDVYYVTTNENKLLAVRIKKSHICISDKSIVCDLEFPKGIVIKFGGIELLDDYISLDKEMWSRNGRNSNNYGMYKNILTNLKECAFIAIAYLENEPQSGMLSYYNNRMMYYMFAASKTSTIGFPCRRSPALHLINSKLILL